MYTYIYMYMLASFGGERVHHISDPPCGFGRYNSGSFVRGVVFPTAEVQKIPSLPCYCLCCTSLFRYFCYRCVSALTFRTAFVQVISGPLHP